MQAGICADTAGYAAVHCRALRWQRRLPAVLFGRESKEHRAGAAIFPGAVPRIKIKIKPDA